MNFINNNELIQQRFRQMYSRDFERMEAEAKQREERNNIGKPEVNKADEPSVGQAKDDEEYKKKVKKLLNKYGVDEIKDLTEKQKKNFFSELDESHTSEKEMKKSDKKLEKSFLILGVNDYISSIETKTEDTMKTEQNDIEKAKYYKREGTPGNYKYYYTKEEYDKTKGGKKKEKLKPVSKEEQEDAEATGKRYDSSKNRPGEGGGYKKKDSGSKKQTLSSESGKKKARIVPQESGFEVSYFQINDEGDQQREQVLASKRFSTESGATKWAKKKLEIN